MFNKRSEEVEIMDDLQCNGDVVAQTLRELEFINTWLGGNSVTLNALNKCLNENPPVNKSLRIADIGCGGGDMLKLILKKIKKEKYKAELIGVDANPFIINYARNNTKEFPEIKFQEHDVLSEDFRNEKYDIVNCTLFCHHFDSETLKTFLKNLKQQTSQAIIINDIHRHAFAYYSIKWLTAIFSKSEMVKYDAKLSVLRAFNRSELEEIISGAGFTNYSIKWRWAFRYEAIIKI